MAGNTWELSPAPAAELVAMVLRTQLGGCALDPGLGVDWATLRKVATGAPALARDAITTGLQRLVRAGQVRAASVLPFGRYPLVSLRDCLAAQLAGSILLRGPLLPHLLHVE